MPSIIAVARGIASQRLADPPTWLFRNEAHRHVGRDMTEHWLPADDGAWHLVRFYMDGRCIYRAARFNLYEGT